MAARELRVRSHEHGVQLEFEVVVFSALVVGALVKAGKPVAQD